MSYYNDDLEYASLLIQEGHKDEASRLIREYLDKFPDDPDAWYLFAAAAPIPEYSIRHLQRALDIDPFHSKARAALAKIQAAQERAATEPSPEAIKREVIVRRVVMIFAVVMIILTVIWMLNLLQRSRAEERVAMATAHSVLTLIASVPTASPVPLLTLPPPAIYEAAFDPDTWVNLAGSAGEVAFEGDGLALTGTEVNQLTSRTIAEQIFRDGVFALDVRKEAGPLNDGTGLALRVDPDLGDQYLFVISSDGYAAAFFCENWCEDALTELVPWTPFVAINQGVGAANTLAVMAEGADFQFRVNDALVAAFHDERRSEGGVGVGTFTFEPGASTVAFKHLTVRLLP